MTDAAGDYVRLLDSVCVVPLDSEVVLLRGREVMRVRGPVDVITAVTGPLAAGAERATVVQAGPPELTGPLLGELARRGWVTNQPPLDLGGAGWQRQAGYLTLFGTDAARMQQRISAATVAVVGVGGIGALVAQHLAAAGVHRFVLADFDRVAVHNLNRQYLFGVDDIGEPKTVAAARALRRLSPDVDAMLVERRFVAAADFEALPDDISALVMAADGPPGITGMAWEWAAPRGVPVTMGAVGLGTGYWGPLLAPALGHCWHCFEATRTEGMSDLDRLLESRLREPTPHSFGPANSVVAALAAHDLIRFLATGDCATLAARGVFDTLGMRVSMVGKPEPDCPHHTHPTAPDSAGEASHG